MVTQSFNSFIKSTQRKMQYGNLNEGEVDEQKLMDRFYCEGFDFLRDAVCETDFNNRIFGVCEVVLFLLKCFDVDFTDTSKNVRERSYPEQIFVMCLSILKSMEVDVKNTLHEMVKFHASINKGYHDDNGKFTKYRAVYKKEEIEEECEEVEGGWRTKSGEYINKIYSPSVIYK